MNPAGAPRGARANPAMKTPRTRSAAPLAVVMTALATLVAQAQTASSPSTRSATDEDGKGRVALDPFTVTTTRDFGYRSSNSIAATRTDTPIKDLPLNIMVFTKDLMEDLGITEQVGLTAFSPVMYDGGIDRHSDNIIQQTYQAFLFRGFLQDWALRDGVREYDPIDAQNLARVEVVKGPAAAIYGLTYPGGIVQSLTKAAEPERTFGHVAFTAGSEGDWRATLDANDAGRIGSSVVAVRVNGVYSRTKDERAHSAGRTDLAAVALLWEPRPSTRVEFQVERGYRAKPNGLIPIWRAEYPGFLGVVPINNAEIPLQIDHPEIPWTWNWSNGRNYRSLETQRYRGTLTAKISADFQVQAYWQYQRHDNIDANGWGTFWDEVGSIWYPQFNVPGWGETGWIIDPETHQERIQSAYNFAEYDNHIYCQGVTAVIRTEFARAAHTFAFGLNSWFENADGTYRWENAPRFLTYSVAAAVPIPDPGPPAADLAILNNYSQRNSNHFFYLNWQASWWHDRLKTNVGLSQTGFKLVNYPNDFSPDLSVVKTSRFSSLFGLVFNLTGAVSLFAVRATSLFPDNNSNSWHQPFPPYVGKSIEGGLKVETADGQLGGTISCYDIRRIGGDQYDPLAPNAQHDNFGDRVVGGEQESKGLDVDLVFQPTRSWQLMLSYAYNAEANTKAAQAYIIGQSNPGHERNRFALVTKYTVAEGQAKGLYFGAGVSGGDKVLTGYIQWPADGGPFVALYEPGRTTVDLFGGCPFKWAGRRLRAQFNIHNLTRAPDYAGWKATGSVAVLATERYRVPTAATYRLTLAVDF